jgi:DNA anti-recombination protein RmuC
MKKIVIDDEEAHAKCKELVKAVSIKDVDTKYIKTKTGEMTAMFN